MQTHTRLMFFLIFYVKSTVTEEQPAYLSLWLLWRWSPTRSVHRDKLFSSSLDSPDIKILVHTAYSL